MDMINTNFIVIIPARLASTRLPNKALLDLSGLPMVVRTAKQAQASNAKAIFVATDSQKISAVCKLANIQAILTSDRHNSGTLRLAEAAKILNLDDETIILNLQGDEPLIEPSLLNAVAFHLKDNHDCSASTAAHHMTKNAKKEINNPNVVKVVCDNKNHALYFSRSPIPWQSDTSINAMSISNSLNPVTLKHIGVYAYCAKFLREFANLAQSPLETAESLEQLRILWHGYKIAVYVSPSIHQQGIDTAEDLERVRSYLT